MTHMVEGRVCDCDDVLRASERTAQRIQRKRTKGWRMPEGAVYVGRPTVWGNPWSLVELVRAHSTQPDGSPWTIDDVLRWFRAYVRDCGPTWLAPLRGHDLACWCPLDQPCHADVLLELANA